MLFVAGLIGRSATFQRAGQARDIQTAATLLSLSEWFERNFVIPAYFGVLMTGLLVAWLARWPIWTGLTSGTPKWPLVSLVVFLSPMTFILSYLAPRRKRRAQALARCTVTGESDARISRGAPRSGCTVVSASGVRPHRGCDGADGYQTVLTLLTQGPPSPGLVVALGVRASPTASVQAIRSDGPRRHPRRRDHHLSHQDREADQSGE